MKVETTKFLKPFFINGFIFAAFVVGFDYYDGRELNIFKCIFMFSFFGLFMALQTIYNYKKQLEK